MIAARSYCGAPPLPTELMARWNADPALLAALALVAVLASRADGARRSAGLAAAAVLAVAFVSPLCALSVSLFAARTIHHLILFGVAAPLLAVAWRPRGAIPPLPALMASTAVLWGWHVPAAYDAALRDGPLYWTMQLTLLAGGWLFWSAVRSAATPIALVTIAGGAAQMGMLGAILTFAPRALYASHAATTPAWGIGPLADQQLAGLLMWVAGLVPYALLAMLRVRAGWQRAALA